MKQSGNNAFSTRQTNGSATAFVLITLCFALWGFAFNITTPMVDAFSKIFRISTIQATLVPIVFNLGYFCLAIPAALFIRRFSFKAGIIAGLAVYAIGALAFLPANALGSFGAFLSAYFILAGGLSMLETTCNPYVYCMGNEDNGILRLNAAQAFNAIGAVAGMYIAMNVQSNFSPVTATIRQQMPNKEFNIVKGFDLDILTEPYTYLAAVILLVIVVTWLNRHKLPRVEAADSKKPLSVAFRELFQHENYREGVAAEFFYVGAQSACWCYIILYGTRIFMAEGMTEQAAEVMSQKMNIIAIVFFACGRFVCTWLLQWLTPERMLSTLGILGFTALIGVVMFTDRNGIYCLVAVSICLSMMFPTIYGLALRGVKENIKIASAGLTMSFLGASVFLPVQAVIIQSDITLLGLPSTNLSFMIPQGCLAMVVWYAHRAYVRYSIPTAEEQEEA